MRLMRSTSCSAVNDGRAEMKQQYSAAAAEKAAAAIHLRSGGGEPSIGLILGSGLGGLAKTIAGSVRIPFAVIPGVPDATVAGNGGARMIGEVGGWRVVAP